MNCENEKVSCEICGNKYRRITNTHLWKSHQMTTEEYQRRFPGSPIEAEDLKDSRQAHKRGKSYEEMYGDEKAGELKAARSESATEQMKDPAQRELRKVTSSIPQTEVNKIASRERATIHGGNSYRRRGLDHYGLECSRCGYTSETEGDFHVHHKDLLNVHSILADHSVNNLEVLCVKCHKRLHRQLNSLNIQFKGISNIEKGMHYILKGMGQELGVNLNDVNFKDTPKRVARAYAEIFEGSLNREENIKAILETGFPSEGYKGIILCKGINTFSMCPHHFLPVEYNIHIAYLPSEEGFVLGLSKLARIAELCAKQPLMQESITNQIGRALEAINPDGVAVLTDGDHMCMRMRGVKQHTSSVTATYRSGRFNEELQWKEFLRLISL